MKRVISVILIVSLFGLAYGKRFYPQKVNPIVHDGVVYKTVPWKSENGSSQNGGFLSASDLQTGKQLWLKQIYKTHYQENLERDVQDVFIKSLKLNEQKNGLMVRCELGRVFHLDFKGKFIQSLIDKN